MCKKAYTFKGGEIRGGGGDGKASEKQLVLWAGGLKLGFLRFCDLWL